MIELPSSRLAVDLAHTSQEVGTKPPMKLNVTFDHGADAANVILGPGKYFGTVFVNHGQPPGEIGDLVVHLDENGLVRGIEILSISTLLA